jgi:hypothetical protein
LAVKPITKSKKINQLIKATKQFFIEPAIAKYTRGDFGLPISKQGKQTEVRGSESFVIEPG